MNRSTSHHSHPLDESAQSYLKQLIAEYRSLPAAATSGKPEAKAIADEIVARAAEQEPAPPLTWDDLHALEIALLRLQPLAKLRRQAWNLRIRYRDIAGQRLYDIYQASNPPDPKTQQEAEEKEEEFRADLERLLSEIHWLHEFLPNREEARNQLSRRAGTWTIVIALICLVIFFIAQGFRLSVPAVSTGGRPALQAVVAVAVMLLGVIGSYLYLRDHERRSREHGGHGNPVAWWIAVGVLVLSLTALGAFFLAYGRPSDAGRSVPFALLALAMLSGAIGGFVSMQRRLQTINSEGAPLVDLLELQYGQFTVLLSPVSGAIFAALLYMVFVGGLVGGDLFPRFMHPADPSGAAARFSFTQLNSAGPATAADFGKLIVWAFIAGFAEKFVPDTLNKIIDKTKATEGPTLPSDSPGGPGKGGGNASAAGAPAGASAEPGMAKSAIPPEAAGAPRLLSTTPISGGTIGPSDPLVVRFSVSMADVDPALTTIPAEGEGEESIDLEKRWNEGRTELTLTHAPLHPGSYRLVLEMMILPDETEIEEPVQIDFIVA